MKQNITGAALCAYVSGEGPLLLSRQDVEKILLHIFKFGNIMLLVAILTKDMAKMAHMVAQLKRSEREKNMMKIQYEEKLAQQQQKIRETELERDQVLASLGNTCFSLLIVVVVE